MADKGSKPAPLSQQEIDRLNSLPRDQYPIEREKLKKAGKFIK